MTTGTIDTATLDEWLAEYVLGWFKPQYELLHAPIWRDPCNRNRPRTARGLSTTGDGRALVEAALIERGYSLCLHIFEGGTFVDVFKGGALPPVVEDIEHADTDMAVALAARATIETEAS